MQGVSYRYHAQREAGRLGVTGWVRNEPDGSVAGHFEGDAEAVDALVDWCRRGPTGARVDPVGRPRGRRHRGEPLRRPLLTCLR